MKVCYGDSEAASPLPSSADVPTNRSQYTDNNVIGKTTLGLSIHENPVPRECVDEDKRTAATGPKCGHSDPKRRHCDPPDTALATNEIRLALFPLELTVRFRVADDLLSAWIPGDLPPQPQRDVR